MDIFTLVRKIDTALTRLVQHIPSSAQKVLALSTHLGSAAVLLLTTTGIAGVGLITQSLSLVMSSAWIIAGMVVIYVLKMIFRRARPDTEYAKKMMGYSFPSGHSGGAMLVYGFLGILAGPPMLLLAFGLVGLVGLSRVYLGAHHPSDVGFAWLVSGTILYLITSNYV